MRRVFDDPRVDIVSIATPHHWHALAAIWAMQAGKDVYVEKPISHNVHEGRRLVQAARRHQRICQAGMQARSNPGVIEAIALRARRRDRSRLSRTAPFVTSSVRRLGHAGSIPSRNTSTTTSGSGQLPPRRSLGRISTTTGTGSGPTATANWDTRGFIRWISAAGDWGCPPSASTC